MGSHVTACLPRSPKRKVSLHPNRSKIRIPLVEIALYSASFVTGG
jgi:hypothetical protein